MKRVATLLVVLASPSIAGAVTRTEVIQRAKAYALHPWTSRAANQTASCSAAYQSHHPPGDYLGLPYDWGGYMTLAEFDQQIASGLGAGSQPEDGILACTAGVDCSGFVSMCWKAGHFTTSGVHTVSAQITQAELLAGDIFNKAGEHMAMFSHLLASGEPYLWEAGGYNVHAQPFGGWSYVMGYVPRRFDSIEGTSAADPQGTVGNPIPITSFPFSDDRDTRQSMSDVFDKCAIATQNESGPEYVYKVSFAQPGQLTVSVSDDAGADIDVHLYSSFNTGDCVARHDATFTQAVDCGTYYIVADTFTSSGGPLAGAYHLTVSFTPSAQACGTGPHVYDTPGEPGDPCAYPGHDDLPFCNPTLGADTCVYSTQGSGGSYCARPCDTVADCGAYPGGCCEDLGNGEKYCMPQSWCGGGSGGSTTPKPKPMDATDGGDPTDGGAEPGVDAGGEPGPGGDEGGCTMNGRPSQSSGGLVMLVLVFGLVTLRGRARS